MSRLIDLTGQKFGRLTVIARAENKGKRTMWLCECDCENHTRVIVDGGNLKSGHTTSCGCYNKEQTKKSNKKLRKKNTYIDKGDYLEGYDANGNMFMIDKDDYEKVSKYYWGLNKATGYWSTSEIYNDKRMSYKLHQIVCPTTDKNVEPDHYDRNKSNNRRNNLILKSHRENSINSGLQTNNTSGIIGVTYCKSEKKWRATINFDIDKTRIVGRFKSKEKAIVCRLVYEYEEYKENAPQRDLFEQYGINEDFVKNYLIKNKQRANNKTGITGVHNNKKDGKWYAYISIDKKIKHLGIYNTKEEAAKVRLNAEKEYYDEKRWQKCLWKEYGVE